MLFNFDVDSTFHLPVLLILCTLRKNMHLTRYDPWELSLQALGAESEGADSFKALFKVLLNCPHCTLIFCHSSMSGELVLSIDPQRAFLVHQRGTEGETQRERQEPHFQSGTWLSSVKLTSNIKLNLSIFFNVLKSVDTWDSMGHKKGKIYYPF